MDGECLCGGVKFKIEAIFPTSTNAIVLSAVRQQVRRRMRQRL